MKDLTPKQDNTSPASDGEYPADEFNDFHDDVQNAVELSGQTLTTNLAEDNRQTLKAIAAGGASIERATGQTALVGDRVHPLNSAAAVTINLPLGAGLFFGASVDFIPIRGQLYSAFSLTIGANGENIAGAASDFVMNSIQSDNQIVRMEWNGTDWDVHNIGVIAI